MSVVGDDGVEMQRRLTAMSRARWLAAANYPRDRRRRVTTAGNELREGRLHSC